MDTLADINPTQQGQIMDKNITPEFIGEVFEQATLLLSYKEIAQATTKMAVAINKKLATKNPILLTVMNGGMLFASELARQLSFPLQMDYIHATRYVGTTGGENLHWKKLPTLELEGRVVLVVDDLLDGGMTLTGIIDYCMSLNAAEIYTAVMLDKKVKRVPGAIEKADFSGLPVGDEYVFGFGLDYYDYLRNVPGIYAVHDKHR